MARKRQQKDAQKQAIQAKRLTDFAKFQEAAGCPKNTACRSSRHSTSFRPTRHVVSADAARRVFEDPERRVADKQNKTQRIPCHKSEKRLFFAKGCRVPRGFPYEIFLFFHNKPDFFLFSFVI